MLALLTGALSLARPPQVIAPAADPTAVTPAAPAAAAVTPTAPVAGAVTPPAADPAAVTAPVSGAVTPPVADPAAATPPVVDPAAGAPAAAAVTPPAADPAAATPTAPTVGAATPAAPAAGAATPPAADPAAATPAAPAVGAATPTAQASIDAAETRASAAAPASADSKNDELSPQCIRLKEEGLGWKGSTKLIETMLDRFAATKIVLISPDDPYKGEGYSAERQYARTLLEWAPVKNKKLDFSVFNYFHKSPTGVNNQPTLPPPDAGTIFVVIGILEEDWGKDVVDALKKRGSAVFGIHDSLCFGCGEEGKGGCPGKLGIPLGCPNLAENVLNGYPDDLERLYFTPWGSERATLYPEKTDKPSMFVDATKDWTNTDFSDRKSEISAKKFVELVQAAIPDMELTVLGDETIQQGKGVTHYMDRLPLEQFQTLLRTSWFFATGIESSYELSLSDAAMAGALLVDIGDASKGVLKPSESVNIASDKDVSTLLAEAVQRYKTDQLDAKTHEWAVNFHSDGYLWLNLLCGMHADTKPNRYEWSRLMYPSPDLAANMSVAANMTARS